MADSTSQNLDTCVCVHLAVMIVIFRKYGHVQHCQSENYYMHMGHGYVR